MEPPASFKSEAVRDEQAKVLHAIKAFNPDDVLQNTVRGQYGEGEMDGAVVPGYRKEPGVAPESRTETFVAMKLAIDNWRWAGIPFYIRTGKRMARRHTEVTIQFKRTPLQIFQDTAGHKLRTNQLVIQIQPEEGMMLSFGAKIPGSTVRVGSVDMSCEYAQYFKTEPKTGYEILLYDCMIGDQTLFQRADMVEAGWTVVDPVLDVWRAVPPRKFPNYAAGTWGPKEADTLLEREGRKWRSIP
jgi:glucose-6-phosphate 1-dehydrogenase